MFQMPAPAENSLKFQWTKQNSVHAPTYSANDAKFASFISHLPYVLDACPGKELSEIPANQAKFASFTHKFHELRKLCVFRTKIHSHLVHYFQASDHRQRTLENWSESTRFRAVCPQLPWITRNLLNLHPSAPMTNKLGVNPGNSRNVQWTMQVLRLSHNAPANNAKFATFANKTQDK